MQLRELIKLLGEQINAPSTIERLAEEAGLDLGALPIHGVPPRDAWLHIVRHARQKKRLGALLGVLREQLPAFQSELAEPIEWPWVFSGKEKDWRWRAALLACTGAAASLPAFALWRANQSNKQGLGYAIPSAPSAPTTASVERPVTPIAAPSTPESTPTPAGAPPGPAISTPRRLKPPTDGQTTPGAVGTKPCTYQIIRAREGTTYLKCPCDTGSATEAFELPPGADEATYLRKRMLERQWHCP